MKVARFVLKVVATALAVSAVVCAVIAFWDQIMDCIGKVVNRLRCRRQYAEGCCIPAAEDEDYSDWDE